MRIFKSRLLYLGCVGLVMLSGCATVERWVPQFGSETAESTEPATPATAVAETSLQDRFKQSVIVPTDSQKVMLQALQAAILNKQRSAIQSQIAALLRQIERSQPTSSLLSYEIGNGFAALGEQDKAMMYWQQSVGQNNANYYAHLRLASAHKDAGEFDVARSHYNAAIGAWAGLAEGYRNRGIFFDLYVGDKAAALNDYIRYQEILQAQGASTQDVDRWIKEMRNAMDEN
ncbi:hypothetical protein [Alteromonas facilis]|uniref:hypothetical protein n=1 Tax=Alteromonas facilis TaxID=2048004 RepID=UPI000C2901BA|nr:hypothetical protein [Alteromonas facilis]